jgi:hypothetical protein
MKALLLLLLVAPAGGGPACGGARGPEGKHPRFVYLAVLEGLYEEAVEPATARAVLQTPSPGLFVGKCPLCQPARFAFEVYAAHPFLPGYSLADAPRPKDHEGLKHADRPERMKALQAFVARCVERKLARTVMNDEEKAAFKTWAEQGRKLGMSIKGQSFGDSCPSCEGVNGKK